jgi:virulence-associated protein VapD
MKRIPYLLCTAVAILSINVLHTESVQEQTAATQEQPESVQEQKKASLPLSQEELIELHQNAQGYIYVGESERSFISFLASVDNTEKQFPTLQRCAKRIEQGYKTISGPDFSQLVDEILAGIHNNQHLFSDREATSIATTLTHILNTIKGYSLVIYPITEDKSNAQPETRELFISLQTLKELTGEEDEDSVRSWWKPSYWHPRDHFYIRKNLVVGENLTVEGKSYFKDTLYVNEIDPISPATKTEFSGGVKINGDLEVTGAFPCHTDTSFDEDITIEEGYTLFVNEIDPLSGHTTTSFSGHIFVPSGKIIYTDKIEPVSGGALLTLGSGGGSGAIYTGAHLLRVGENTSGQHQINVGGNVDGATGAVYIGGANTNTRGNLTVGGNQANSEGIVFIHGGSNKTSGILCVHGGVYANDVYGMVYTNSISPISGPVTEFGGDLDLLPTKTLHTNYIDPKSGTTTYISGNLELDSTKTLYTNSIDPLSGHYTTSFSGNVYVEGEHFMRVGGIDGDSSGVFVAGGASPPGGSWGSVIIASGTNSTGRLTVGGEGRVDIFGGDDEASGVLNVFGTVYTNSIAPISDNTIEFSGDLDLLPTKTLHTNYIDPLSGSPTTTFSGNIHVQGDISYEGGLSAVSDERIKKNKVYIDKKESLDQVMELLPAHYNFITDETIDPNYGLIAQEVQAVMPEAIDTKATFTFGDAVYEDFLLIKQNVLLTKLLSAFQKSHQMMLDEVATLSSWIGSLHP